MLTEQGTGEPQKYRLIKALMFEFGMSIKKFYQVYIC